MSLIDWLIVVLLNGSVIVYALLKSRDTHSSGDWFLAGRSLPWWMVGLSLYATLIDSADLVVDAGAAYGLGIRYFLANWVGVVGGWVLLAHCIVLPMYRAGMYTNAEYLEARFSVVARVVSVLVQVLYRTVMIGMISATIYLVLRIVCDWSPGLAWTVVAGVALLATVYTMAGGLKSVAITDALQSIIMFLSSVVIFVIVWNEVGGWSGLESRLVERSPELAEQMLHVGSDPVTRLTTEGLAKEEIARQLLLGGRRDNSLNEIVRTTPAWLACLSLIIAGLAYSIVNHTQSMRLLGARSERDLKMSVVLSSLIVMVVTFLTLAVGVMGKALFPEVTALPVDESIRKIDAILPVIIRDFTSAGFKGIVIAGIFAAGFSTYDSIGSTLSALITRDFYARLLVRDRDDQHYLTVGRWLTPVIIFGSFLYVPALMAEGMIFFYLKVVGSFVVPLLTIYLMGSLTRVHRSSATVGLIAGVLYGIVALLAPGLAIDRGIALLPVWLMDGYATGPMTLFVTAGSMILYSLIRGWAKPGELLAQDSGGWLERSQMRVQGDAEVVSKTPLVLALIVVGISLALSFGVFW